MFTRIMNEQRIDNFLYSFFQFLISILFSVILAGQLFGILKIYNFYTVLPFTIISTISIYLVWKKTGRQYSLGTEISTNHNSNFPKTFFTLGTYFISLLLFLLLIIPILNWPNNTMENELNWDAGEYHFPKAIELYSTSSAWDFSISYGEYPFGYESLLSLNLLLTNDLSLFSISHVVITMLFIFSCWFLLRKYSKFPPALLLLILLFLLLSGFFSFFNPWASLRFTIFTIGKNDLFLAAGIIATIFFASPCTKNNSTTLDWIGLGLCTSISFSIKPNSFLIIGFLWLFILGNSWYKEKKINFSTNLLGGLFLSSTGLIWIIRNFIGQGYLFRQNTFELTSHSIFNNLFDPTFISKIPNELTFSLLILLITLFMIFIKEVSISIYDFCLLLVIFFSFIITPASTDPMNLTLIAWRFGTVLLIIQFIFLITIGELILFPLLRKVFDNKYLIYGLLFSVSIPVIMFIYWQHDLVRFVPEKSDLLIRPYEVGNAKYKSVFDYVDENISNSVVWVEGAQSFYAYDPNFTNSITRNLPADYIIFVDYDKNDLWISLEEWKEIYSDDIGSIYKRLISP